MTQPTALDVVDGVDLTGKTCAITDVAPYAVDHESAARLWALSESLVSR
ncbi:hypothetical protein [Mycobacterium talmoniae]|uniref:Uncharacterized protein n=1 Tax=Mycobacterium talmoniae TaxID=1858794 RepID=A0A2S8BEH7_9MYCO|nr:MULTISPECIES: hypothetical protein [Mycobacterium]PQM45038.1 hypothetical protein C1Y40_04806 [Mycobacterium talmoniae]